MRRTLVPAAAVLLTLTACSYGGEADELRNDLAAVTADEAAPAVPDTGEGEGPQEEAPEGPVAEPVEVPTDLVDVEGSVLGGALLQDAEQGTEIDVEVAGLAAGFHPMALYAVGDCTAGDDPAAPFPSVGELLVPLPPLLVVGNGAGSLTALVDQAPLVEQLLAEDGTALIVGEAVADPATAPVGQEPPISSRVACAAFGE